jgi:hypothetical protein
MLTKFQEINSLVKKKIEPVDYSTRFALEK